MKNKAKKPAKKKTVKPVQKAEPPKSEHGHAMKGRADEVAHFLAKSAVAASEGAVGFAIFICAPNGPSVKVEGGTQTEMDVSFVSNLSREHCLELFKQVSENNREPIYHEVPRGGEAVN